MKMVVDFDGKNHFSGFLSQSRLDLVYSSLSRISREEKSSLISN